MRKFGVVLAWASALLLVGAAPAAAQTLTLTKTSLGSVTSDPAGIECLEGCTSDDATYPRYRDPECDPAVGPCPLFPQQVTLTASTTRPGVSFTGWSGACEGTQTTCVVSMMTGKDVGATFADVQDPTVSLTGPAAGAYRGGTNVLAQANASDNIGVTRVEFLYKGVVVAADGSAPYQAQIATGATSGTYDIQARAVDTSGRISTLATRQITVDADAPVITIGVAPEWSDGGAEKVNFQIDGEVGDPTCSYNGSPFGACTGATSHTVQVPADATGTQVVSIRAVDGVGNETIANVDFEIDRLAPTLTFGAMPSHTSDSMVVFPYAIDGTGSAAAVDCRRDGGPLEPCTSPSEYAWHDLTEGTHTLTVVVSDQAGNTAEFTRTLVVDRTAPATSISGGPADGAKLTAPATAAYDLAASEDGVTFACRIYPQGTTAPAFGACSGPGARHTAAALGVGSYVFEVRATDQAGNVGTVATRTLTVEAAPGPGPGPVVGGGPVVTPPRIAAKVGASWRVTRRHTIVRRLAFTGVPEGASVQATCKGRRRSCAFSRRAFPVRSGTANLTAAFRKRRLLPGTVIEVRILKEGAVSQTVRITVRRGRKPAVRTL